MNWIWILGGIVAFLGLAIWLFPLVLECRSWNCRHNSNDRCSRGVLEIVSGGICRYYEEG